MDAFSKCHPAVNFLFFVGAIGFGVVIQHPAYLAAGLVSGLIYHLVLTGPKGWKLPLAMVPVFVLITVINPVFNTYGKTVLFLFFGRNYTLEALIYGMTLGGMFVLMMLWFSCYNQVLTSDKFVCLFGSLIPSLSLLLVMILRLMPSFMRKTRQILGARNSIGKGTNEHASVKERILAGTTVMSALTDWALEGSIVTADSMRARGYGTAKRTNFQIYRFTARDILLLAVMLVLAATVLALGGTAASFTPDYSADPVGWGLAAYGVFLLLPVILHVKEAIVWRISISKM